MYWYHAPNVGYCICQKSKTVGAALPFLFTVHVSYLLGYFFGETYYVPTCLKF